MANTKNINFAESRRIDALVFVDGVEVPFSWLEVSFTTDSPSQATIAIEADPLIDQWRPKSFVHIFIRKPFSDQTPDEAKQLVGRQRDEAFDQESYALYWEGELVGLQMTEGAENRSVTLVCRDLWNIPDYAALSMTGIGADLRVPIVNGSTFFAAAIDDDGSSSMQFVLAGLITYLFGENAAAKPNTPVALAVEKTKAAAKGKLDPTVPTKKKDIPEKSNMSDLMRLLMEFLALYNASYGLQAHRTRLFEKLTSIADSSLGKFIEATQAAELITMMVSQLNADTVGSLMLGVLQKFFHHTVSLPFPVPVLAENSTSGSAAVKQYRSMAIVPNLHYSIPPFCNWLFPDQYQQRSVERNFMAEPTRLGLRTSLGAVIGEMIHLAPDALANKIFGSFKDPKLAVPTGAKATATASFGGQEANSGVVNQNDVTLGDRLRETGFYAVNPDGSVNVKVNRLAYLTAEEIEKGILFQQDSNEYQATLTRAAANAQSNLRTTDKTAAKDTYQSQTNTPGTYPYFMRLLAEYQLLFRKLSRSISVAGPFNPWPVVGLPMLLVRQNSSYRGLLVGVVSRIDYGGQSQTSYQLEYGQLMRPEQLSAAADAKIAAANRDRDKAVAVAVDLREQGILNADTAVDTYDQLAAAAQLVAAATTRASQAEATTRLRGAVDKIGTRSYRTGSLAALSATMRRFWHFMSLIAQVPTSQSVSTGVEASAAADAQSVKQEKDDSARLNKQIQALFSGTNNYLAQYVGLLALLNNLVHKFYYETSAVALDSGTSYDLAAYQAKLAKLMRLISESKDPAAVTAAKLEVDDAVIFDWLYSLNDLRYAAADMYASPGRQLSKQDIDQYFRSLKRVLVKPSGKETTATVSYKDELTLVAVLTAFWQFYEAYATRKSPEKAQKDFQHANTATADVADFIRSTPIEDVLGTLAFELIEVTRFDTNAANLATVQAFETALTQAITSLGEATAEINTKALDIPPVLPFMNQDLADVASVDQALQNLVVPLNPEGTYASRLSGAQTEEMIKFDKATRSVNPDVHRNTVLRFDAFLRVARKVFPFTDSETVTEYQEHKAAGDVHAWANSVQARKTVSLAEFLSVNRLMLEKRTVESPVGPGYYYVMRQKTATTTGKAAIDGYFSKFGATPQGVDDNLTRSVADVGEAMAKNEEAKAILSEAGRQALIIAYTSRHAVPAAYQGKK